MLKHRIAALTRAAFTQAWLTRPSLMGLILVLLWCNPDRSFAQVEPDSSLGTESSRVSPNVTVRGGTGDRIDGGARRGSNLFHSFRTFNVRENGRLYFANPDGVENILTRVTGSSATNILGTLGIEGGANLFLLNPNGIFFGANARLDLRGSFLATTASGFRFGNNDTFSATDPSSPGLLTVSAPTGLQYGSTSGSTSGSSTSGSTSGEIRLSNTQLAVDPGRNLTLAGGTITLNNSRITTNGTNLSGANPIITNASIGGQVDLLSITGSGLVSLNPSGNSSGSPSGNPSGNRFSFPTAIARGTIELNNQSTIDVSAATSGAIALDGSDITLRQRSLVQAGIAPGVGTLTSQAGDISLTASGTIRLEDTSRILNQVGVNQNPRPLTTVGNAGNIRVNTGSLLMNGGSRIDSRTLGRGNAGNIVIDARDRIVLEGIAREDPTGIASAIGSSKDPQAAGQGGSIQLTANRLSLLNGAGIFSGVNGQGVSGGIRINVRDQVELLGSVPNPSNPAAQYSTSIIFSGVAATGRGRGGDVRLSANQLTIADGSIIQSLTQGEGDAGNVFLDVRDRIRFDGVARQGLASSGVTSSTIFAGRGRGGNITLNTDRLEIANGGRLFSSTVGITSRAQGSAGDITVNARDILIDGTIQATDRDRNPVQSGIFAGVARNGRGEGGDVRITTDRMSLTNGGTIVAENDGQGRGGQIDVNVRDRLSLNGSIYIRSNRYTSQITTSIADFGTGRAGDVRVTANRLDLTNGAIISSDTRGAGDAGNVRIEANRIRLSGRSIDTAPATIPLISSGFSTSVLNPSEGFPSRNNFPGGRGNSGSIEVIAQSLDMDNVARIEARTFRSGNAGNIRIDADQLRLRRGAQIEATTLGLGNAGNIEVRSDRIMLDGVTQDQLFLERNAATNPRSSTGIFAGVLTGVLTSGRGQGGTIQIRTNALNLTNGAQLFSSTSGFGDSGNIRVDADGIVLDGGGRRVSQPTGIFARVETGGIGQGGTIRLTGDRITLRNGAEVSATTAGIGAGGNVLLRSEAIALRSGSRISATTFGIGNGGDVRLNGDRISIAGSRQERIQLGGRVRTVRQRSAAVVAVGERGIGDGGTMRVTANQLDLDQSGALIANSTGQGVAGNINVTAQEINLSRRGEVSARTTNGTGGNIRLTTDRLQLQSNSQITAAATNGASGGNIDINNGSGFIVATPDSNSDISANADLGQGGEIAIRTQGIYGFGQVEAPQLDLAEPSLATTGETSNASNEISASSQYGQSGTVTINRPEFDPNRGLIELPTTLLSSQPREGCQVSGQPGSAAFYRSGRGGLPPSPLEALSAMEVLTDLRAIADANQPNTDQPNTDQPNTDQPNTDQPNTDQPNTDQPNTQVSEPTNLSPESPESPESMVRSPAIEAQQLALDPQGKPILLAERPRRGHQNRVGQMRCYLP